MGELITIAYENRIDPSSSGRDTITTVEAGHILTLKRMTAYVSAGGTGFVRIKLMRGEETIVPIEGSIVPTDAPITVTCEEIFFSDSKVTLWYENGDASNPYTIYILLEGELE